MGEKHTVNKPLITITLRLVQCHYEGREFDFGMACDDLELWLYDNDRPELAEYVCAQQYPQCAFVPM